MKDRDTQYAMSVLSHGLLRRRNDVNLTKRYVGRILEREKEGVRYIAE
jgi:hypothetical protein